jgi:putative ATP-dependent endonuclease of OLD family
MKVKRLVIRNFRGVSEGVVDFASHTLLVGGNNVGKSTVCEALDLVLGPERLYRRPVVDEHDFYKGAYLDHEGRPTEIRIEAILTELSEEAELRFHRHLRRWSNKKACFVDEAGGGPEVGDEEDTCWALPVLFIGRYDSGEDDFIGNTFLAHPVEAVEEDEDVEKQLAPGLKFFTREHKRLCGFVFLRTLRTGSRALSLQRGSLLDTILRLAGGGFEKMWHDTLTRLKDLDPPIGDIEQLRNIQSQVQARMAQFVNLAPDENATAFFASELTREHLREVIRLFIASEPTEYLVPFQRQGTGAINMLVFALLTFIAELKDKRAVIFAMEEPEIALPPHTQRRVARFVLGEMGQAIVTSHSPYVIEQFEPEQIVILDHPKGGTLAGKPIDVKGVKPRTFKVQRRQFAEAILSRAVLVVEGSTEAALFPEASTVLEATADPKVYTHLDLAGVTVFDAGGDGSVPRYGPIFKSLGKKVYGFYDKPEKAFKAEAQAQLKEYTKEWESPQMGIENLLVEEMKPATLRHFLQNVQERPDFPKDAGMLLPETTDADVKEIARRVLKARKGDAHGYGALLISSCKTAEELPETIRTILGRINQDLSADQKKAEPQPGELPLEQPLAAAAPVAQAPPGGGD